MTPALLLTAFLLLVATLSGCGGATGVSGQAGPTAGGVSPMAMTSLTLGNANANPADYRWGDIAGNVYTSAYDAGFSYGTPTVTVSFDDMGTTTLSGTITATGLKPNFAYQMKLEGLPTIDAWANEQIGYLGRWWSPVSGNVDDTYYQRHKKREAIIGYLVFGFFITDSNGSVTNAPFRVDSSYHVLWNLGQSDVPTDIDQSAAQQWPPAWTSAAYGGDSAPAGFISATQTIAPEIQTGRPAPGDAILPVGSYHCAFVITEESFHDYYAGGGNWAAAMRSDNLFFGVTAPLVHDVAITGISLPGTVYAGQSNTVGVTVANQGNTDESSVEVTLTDSTAGVDVGTQTVAIAAGKSTTIQFSWTPSRKGKNTLQASAAQVAGETDLSDNTMTRSVRVR